MHHSSVRLVYSYNHSIGSSQSTPEEANSGKYTMTFCYLTIA